MSCRRLAAEAFAGSLSAGELSTSTAGAPPPARRCGLNCFTWVADGVPAPGDSAAGGAGAPLAGVPLAVKDLFCTEGVPSQSGSRILEGYQPPYTATRRRAPARRPARRCSARPTRTSSRWAPRPRTPRSARAQPLGSRARPRRLLRRQRRRGRRWARAVGARHRHRRLDPPARRALRHRRPQAHLRRRLALRDDRLRLLARPGRPAHARRRATPR